MDEDVEYEELVRLVHAAPMTFLPALIVEVMKAGYEKNVWLDGKCCEWVRLNEERLNR